MEKLFGTDGVRGEANSFLTPDLAYKLGKAAAHFLKEEACSHKKEAILIGKDTRISGDMLEASLAAGICSMGLDVYLLGVCPTPAVAYITREEDFTAGVMISASHNPAIDNGIKFFDSKGYKLPDQMEDKIEDFIINNKIDSLPVAPGDKTGRIFASKELLDSYKNFLLEEFKINLPGIKLLVDCANGSASQIMPELLTANGLNFKAIHNQPDGLNINLNCGSTSLDSLKESVLKEGADLGIAYDGDSDRVLFVDHLANEVDGDMVMAMAARYLKKKDRLENNLVVGTVMSNLGLEKFFEKEGIDFVKAQVGDRYVLEKMRELGGNFGGEQSGHLIFLDYNTTGDGILTALILLKIIEESGLSLEELLADFVKYPQLLENVRVENKVGWDRNEKIMQAIAKKEAELAGEGRILVRASGTEDIIRVMAEGKDQATIKNIVGDLCQLIAGELS